MKRIKLNQDTEDVGKVFKVISISLIVILNLIVFLWLFFFSGLIN